MSFAGNCIEAHYPHFDGNGVPFIVCPTDFFSRTFRSILCHDCLAAFSSSRSISREQHQRMGQGNAEINCEHHELPIEAARQIRGCVGFYNINNGLRGFHIGVPFCLEELNDYPIQ